MSQEEVCSLARAILLVGGIVAVAYGATLLGNYISSGRTFTDIFAVQGSVLGVVVGVVALVASSKVRDEPMTIVLAVLGFQGGWPRAVSQLP